VAADAARANAAAALIAAITRNSAPCILSSLDQTEHDNGPDTAQAAPISEALDGIVGTLIAAARAAEPDVVVTLVSDHGFAAISHDVNLVSAFADAGPGDRGKRQGQKLAGHALVSGGLGHHCAGAPPRIQQ